MFTGIIKKTTKVISVEKRAGNLGVSVAIPKGVKISLGQSISVNGICSTIRGVRKKELIFEYIPETLRQTTVRWWKKGEVLNLEQSLRFGDSLDGHLVTGHVEGVGQIAAGVHEKGDILFKIETTGDMIEKMVKKGSVAIDGVSLTIADVGENWFAVALIPYTVEHTNWKKRAVGDIVNIETDILGRQRAKQVISYATPSTKSKKKKRLR